MSISNLIVAAFVCYNVVHRWCDVTSSEVKTFHYGIFIKFKIEERLGGQREVSAVSVDRAAGVRVCGDNKSFISPDMSPPAECWDRKQKPTYLCRSCRRDVWAEIFYPPSVETQGCRFTDVHEFTASKLLRESLTNTVLSCWGPTAFSLAPFFT